MKKILFLVFFFATVPAHAYDTFHPEADEALQNGETWVEVTFKRHDYKAHTSTRAWYPYPAEEVWKILIDTNTYKERYSDYSDSRTLDKNQFDLVVRKKPDSIKGFYELVGGQEFPSEYGRKPGSVWASYILQRFNLPWPLNDRWGISRVKNDESQAHKGKYRYEYETPAGNFKALKGYWELVPVPGRPRWTEFRGEYDSDPGIQYPQFVARSLFRSSMKKSVEVNKKALEAKLGTAGRNVK
ncbi:MAG: hypothetical protein HYU99_09610 [Deltaproteobacteria bacterium]|nr:hypothetical protein [Deltaproteobacteria bacterium]